MILREVEERTKLFDRVNLVHEKRESTAEAHCLAKPTSSLGAGRSIWLGSLPDICILPMDVFME